MSGLAAAISFYTRIPIRSHASEPAELASSAPWFPVVGLGIGAAIAGVYVGLSFVLPDLLAAVLALSAGAVLTGALHEDGLGDVADAFAGGSSIERRLEILDDPRLGTFGVLALTGAFFTRAAAVGSFDSYDALAILPAAHAISRVPGVIMMRRVSAARRDGLAVSFAAGLSSVHERTTIAIGALLGGVLIGWWAIPAFVTCVVVSVAMTALGRRKIGGISGDVLGATQQLVEIAVLTLGAAVVHESWGELAWWGP